MPGGIAGTPNPRGYKYGTWCFRLGVEQVDNPPCKICMLGNQKCGLGRFRGRSIMEAKAVVPKKKKKLYYIICCVEFCSDAYFLRLEVINSVLYANSSLN